MHIDKEIVFYALVYGMTWLGVHLLIIPEEYLLYSCLIAAMYALGHLVAGVKKGHIALSADSHALPMAFMVALITMVYLNFETIDVEIVVSMVSAYAISLIAGHVILFSLVYVLEKLKR